MLVVKTLPANAGGKRDAGSIPGLEDPLKEGRATQSSILAWKIPWTEEPGRLQFMGSQRVGHDCNYTTLLKINSYTTLSVEGSIVLRL